MSQPVVTDPNLLLLKNFTRTTTGGHAPMSPLGYATDAVSHSPDTVRRYSGVKVCTMCAASAISSTLTTTVTGMSPMCKTRFSQCSLWPLKISVFIDKRNASTYAYWLILSLLLLYLCVRLQISRRRWHRSTWNFAQRYISVPDTNSPFRDPQNPSLR